MSTKHPIISKYTILHTPIGLVLLSVSGPFRDRPYPARYISEAYIESAPGKLDARRFGTPCQMVNPDDPMEHLVDPMVNWLRYRATDQYAALSANVERDNDAWIDMGDDSWPGAEEIVPLKLLCAAVGPEFIEFISQTTMNLPLKDACNESLRQSGMQVESEPVREPHMEATQ